MSHQEANKLALTMLKYLLPVSNLFGMWNEYRKAPQTTVFFYDSVSETTNKHNYGLETDTILFIGYMYSSWFGLLYSGQS